MLTQRFHAKEKSARLNASRLLRMHTEFSYEWDAFHLAEKWVNGSCTVKKNNKVREQQRSGSIVAACCRNLSLGAWRKQAPNMGRTRPNGPFLCCLPAKQKNVFQSGSVNNYLVCLNVIPSHFPSSVAYINNWILIIRGQLLLILILERNLSMYGHAK